MIPYYERDGVALYHADCREFTDWLAADVLVMDPPYGAGYYASNWPSRIIPRSIVGDGSTVLRDWVLDQWGSKPALVFGTWKVPRPEATRSLLIYDKGGATGMGDLSLPWKPSHEEIYVLGGPWAGSRDCGSVLQGRVQSIGRNGREHPNEKDPLTFRWLLHKCIGGVVADPFCGTGPTLVAAKQLGRRAIGVEIDERYCEVAAKRLAQSTLLNSTGGPPAA